MTNADVNILGSQKPIIGQRCFEVFDPAFFLDDTYGIPLDECDTSRIIAAVFKAAKSIQQNGQNSLRSNVSYDATHTVALLTARSG
jgi:hypothetical protein